MVIRLLALTLTGWMMIHPKATIALEKPVSKTAISLDFCADQYLLALADKTAILALSRDSSAPYAYRQKQAKPYKKIRPYTEEILSLSPKPDMAIRQWGGDAQLAPLLTNHHIQLLQLDYVSDFTGIKTNIQKVAAALDRVPQGKALIAELDARLDAIPSRKTPPIKALYVTPGGVTAGKGTMIDTLITSAGLLNTSREAGLSGWPPLPLEKLVQNPPDLIITGFFDSPLENINAWSAARHPLFAKLFKKVPTIHLPVDLISCNAFSSIYAVEYLHAALLEISRKGGL